MSSWRSSTSRMSVTNDEAIAAMEATWGFQHPDTQVVSIGQPAAGAGFTYVLPGTCDTRVIAVSFRLVNFAAAGARIPIVSFQDQGGVSFAAVPAPFSAGNAITTDYTFAIGQNPVGANDAANIAGGIPDLTLPVGFKLALTLVNPNAGDQVSRIRVAVQQFPVRP